MGDCECQRYNNIIDAKKASRLTTRLLALYKYVVPIKKKAASWMHSNTLGAAMGGEHGRGLDIFLLKHDKGCKGKE